MVTTKKKLTVITQKMERKELKYTLIIMNNKGRQQEREERNNRTRIQQKVLLTKWQFKLLTYK